MIYYIVLTKDDVMSLKFVVVRCGTVSIGREEVSYEEIASEHDTAEEAMYYKETLEGTFPSESYRVEVKVG